MPYLPVRNQSFLLPNPPIIRSWAATAGKKESEGPLSQYFDNLLHDSYAGQQTWELAEKEFQKTTINTLIRKAGITEKEIGAVYSGDLLNQCISSSQALNNANIPHLGLYGACSTMAESMLLAAMSVSGGFLNNVIAMTSSHFASSERQFRFPLGYGGQRTPTAQWTVTGSGGVLLSNNGSGPKITCCTIGSVVDLGITDANNMGAAMAPAALSTILTHFHDFDRSPEDFDLIVTGDLGQVGKEILCQLSLREGLSISGKTVDCGAMIFDPEKQDVHSGGSGCGCSAIVLCSKLLNDLNSGKLKRILFCGTGALLSPTSVQQGLSIPGVCHAVCIEGAK